MRRRGSSRGVTIKLQRLQPKYLFILAVAGAVTLVFLLGAIFNRPKQAEAKTEVTAIPSVQVRLTPETQRPYEIVLRGRTQATRSVIVRAETAGVVAEAPVLQGAHVRKGQVLCRLAVDARQASLDQARANLRSRQLQQQAAAELGRKGYRSPTQVLESQANLDNAQAQVRAAEIALAQVSLRAPFAGVFDHRDAEAGAYLSPGQACGTVIELSPLLIVADLPETAAARIRAGAPATARLLSGQLLTGTVRYVAHDADPQTRTYHLEVTTPNADLAVRSGLSAELKIRAGAGPAHLVPTSAMVLDSAGHQGVRYVQADGRVAFAPLQVLETAPDGVWVTGLSGPVQLIVVGQSYVADGQKVRMSRAQ